MSLIYSITVPQSVYSLSLYYVSVRYWICEAAQFRTGRGQRDDSTLGGMRKAWQDVEWRGTIWLPSVTQRSAVALAHLPKGRESEREQDRGPK